jgi:hypothetical protein
MSAGLTTSNSALCVHAFHLFPSSNSYYFHKRHYPLDLRNGEKSCFLCGAYHILEYNLNALQLQSVNKFHSIINTHCNSRSHILSTELNI